mmetsp:Transcript_18995/g.65290  ORF Transcript_18995/g.65290 Transcript_18995/m.65290 type:complete len:240 (-) Transcript_18995:2754-3473(-)
METVKTRSSRNVGAWYGLSRHFDDAEAAEKCELNKVCASLKANALTVTSACFTDHFASAASAVAGAVEAWTSKGESAPSRTAETSLAINFARSYISLRKIFRLFIACSSVEFSAVCSCAHASATASARCVSRHIRGSSLNDTLPSLSRRRRGVDKTRCSGGGGALRDNPLETRASLTLTDDALPVRCTRGGPLAASAARCAASASTARALLKAPASFFFKSCSCAWPCAAGSKATKTAA